MSTAVVIVLKMPSCTSRLNFEWMKTTISQSTRTGGDGRSLRNVMEQDCIGRGGRPGNEYKTASLLEEIKPRQNY